MFSIFITLHSKQACMYTYIVKILSYLYETFL